MRATLSQMLDKIETFTNIFSYGMAVRSTLKKALHWVDYCIVLFLLMTMVKI